MLRRTQKKMHKRVMPKRHHRRMGFLEALRLHGGLPMAL